MITKIKNILKIIFKKLDKIIQIESRKFQAWVVGSVFFVAFTDKLNGDQWLILTGMYIGGNVIQKGMYIFKERKK